MQPKSIPELLAYNKKIEDEICGMLEHNLVVSKEATVQHITDYCNDAKSTLRILPYEIIIDGAKVNEADLSKVKPTSDEGHKRLAFIKSAFEMGKTPCLMSTLKVKSCKNDGKVCYLKLKMKGGSHKESCVYCYECLKYVALAHLNTYIKTKKSTAIWKCACKEPIPPETYMLAFARQVNEACTIIDKNDSSKQKLFCVNCGESAQPMTAEIHPTSFKCEKCSKK